MRDEADRSGGNDRSGRIAILRAQHRVRCVPMCWRVAEIDPARMPRFAPPLDLSFGGSPSSAHAPVIRCIRRSIGLWYRDTQVRRIAVAVQSGRGHGFAQREQPNGACVKPHDGRRYWRNVSRVRRKTPLPVTPGVFGRRRARSVASAGRFGRRPFHCFSNLANLYEEINCLPRLPIPR